MREMSLHIMDIVENALAAGATRIRLDISEDREKNRLEIIIADNGRGIPEEDPERLLDPFYTTRTTRRVGLGLSLFRETSRRCGGTFRIESGKGKGTRVAATFRLDHIDLPPMGDMAGTLAALIAGNPGVDFIYTHRAGDDTFELDTREIRKDLNGVDITHPRILKFISSSIRRSLKALRK